MSAVVLFLSAYALVFFLGLQSLNVNRGHHTAAFFTSFGIGIGQLILYKLAPEANAVEVIAYLSGGPLGIVSSMHAHRLMHRSNKDEQNAK